jgi:hypothetical protein
VLVNSVSSILRKVVAIVHTSQRSLSDYYSIDEHIFGLSEEQKQVMHLYFFHDSADLRAPVL